MDELLQRGIRLFNDGAFFQCHEVLEEAWTTEQGPRRVFLQALIHLAVGGYHHERANRAGPSRRATQGPKEAGRVRALLGGHRYGAAAS
jgi:predicted metal-dependent hydrolase